MICFLAVILGLGVGLGSFNMAFFLNNRTFLNVVGCKTFCSFLNLVKALQSKMCLGTQKSPLSTATVRMPWNYCPLHKPHSLKILSGSYCALFGCSLEKSEVTGIFIQLVNGVGLTPNSISISLYKTNFSQFKIW